MVVYEEVGVIHASVQCRGAPVEMPKYRVTAQGRDSAHAGTETVCKERARREVHTQTDPRAQTLHNISAVCHSNVKC